MPVSIVVPQLGESVAEGTVSKWLKAVGDRVRKEEPLVEIQTDKINVEIPSPAEGTLDQILIAEGTTVLVGTEIGTLSAAGEAPAARPAAAVAAAGGSATAVAAPPATSGAAATPGPAAPPPAGGNGAAVPEDVRNLSPAVRKLMRENDIDAAELSRIRGTGIAGRVTRDDLMVYLANRTGGDAAMPVAASASGIPAAASAPGIPAAVSPAMAPVAPAAPRAPVALPGFAASSPVGAAPAGAREEIVAFTKVRKLIAENMLKSKHTAAHTHCFDEVDMSAIVALKKEWGPKLEAQGVKLTYMPFFVKASVLTLKEFPWVNGEVRGDSIVLKRYYNIGFAVGRDDKGLIVTNLKDCDRKGLVQIAGELNDLAARARADRLKPDEISGGTFSISNAGVYGAINSAPVINVPEVAILGVHKIVERPVVVNGQIVVRPMMNAVIGFDHRVIDGEMAVKFLRRVCELLEKPELLWFYA